MHRNKIIAGTVVMATNEVIHMASHKVCLEPGDIGIVYETYRSIAVVFGSDYMPRTVKRSELTFIGVY
jgi:hypothetical protein